MAHSGDASPAENADDDRLVQAARAGDLTALGNLVERHRPAVTRLLWRFARSHADLEDLVQETFLRVVRGLPDWRAQQPLVHWLTRIASNVGRDYFRRHAVRRRYLVEPPADDADGASPPERVDPDGDPAARAAANEVKVLLASLPPDDRALLTLHHLEGWDLATIGKQYGWTVTATKLRAWRARRRLHHLLMNEGHR